MTNVKLPERRQSEQPGRRALAGSPVLYWLLSGLVVVALLCVVPLGIVVLANRGIDLRLTCAAVLGLVGAVIVVLAVARPRVLGRALASQAHSFEVSRKQSVDLLSVGMSFVVSASAFARQ